jgi:hypothetical protein
MHHSWPDATQTIKALVSKARGIDLDGMDLSFTNGTVNLSHSDDVKEFLKKMDKAKPREDVSTDIKISLGRIFDEWLKKHNRQHQVKDMTLIVLTDGCWGGTVDRTSVDKKIIDFTKEAKIKCGISRERPFSIQFVSFGRTPLAIEHLERLDDELKLTDHGIM